MMLCLGLKSCFRDIPIWMNDNLLKFNHYKPELRVITSRADISAYDISEQGW